MSGDPDARGFGGGGGSWSPQQLGVSESLASSGERSEGRLV